ncbi:hypothetical protein [Halorubrum sodomense]|uniref:Uncharacterized protein n=2 Tax=Halorubrum TaxID=56688 RepID=A0A1I6FMH2_HALSD|nr:hypothetical protein [Halorubrum sodomense]TKX66536.1 hypothetical protein EXE45_15250 [Halorubrum sp. SP9]SFR31130.1 hypothetical protein SAMN04487937_0968 [Halorubrum sodomense]
MTRRRALACVLLLVTAGCAGLGGTAADVTVENAQATEYRLTAYLIEEPVGAGNVTFRATNETGARTTVERLRFETDGPYYNASLSAEWNATERRLVVSPGETRTATFDAWEPGTAVVYVFEAPDGRVVRTSFADCPRDSLSHTFVFSDGPENGYRSTCS